MVVIIPVAVVGLEGSQSVVGSQQEVEEGWLEDLDGCGQVSVGRWRPSN